MSDEVYQIWCRGTGSNPARPYFPKRMTLAVAAVELVQLLAYHRGSEWERRLFVAPVGSSKKKIMSKEDTREKA